MGWVWPDMGVYWLDVVPTTGWVWSDMPSHAQTCLDLPGSEFGWSGSDMVTLEVIQNETLIKF